MYPTFPRPTVDGPSRELRTLFACYDRGDAVFAGGGEPAGHQGQRVQVLRLREEHAVTVRRRRETVEPGSEMGTGSQRGYSELNTDRQ